MRKIKHKEIRVIREKDKIYMKSHCEDYLRDESYIAMQLYYSLGAFSHFKLANMHIYSSIV